MTRPPCAAEGCTLRAVANRKATVEGVELSVDLCAFHNDRIAASEQGREPLYESRQDAPVTGSEHMDDLTGVEP